MLNTDKMVDNISEIKTDIPKSKKVTIDICFSQFNFKNINTLMQKIKYLINHKKEIKKITLNVRVDLFPDVATVVYFNLIVAYIFYEFKNINISIPHPIIKNLNLITNGLIECTPMHQYLSKKITREEFVKLCFSGENQENIKDHYFWKVINYDSISNDQMSLAIKSMMNYLSIYSQDENFNNEILIIIDELVNNALEHSKESVLIYLNVTPIHPTNSNDPFLLFSICILCLSDLPIYCDIKRKLMDSSLSHQLVKDAFSIQKNNFSKEYTVEHFSTLAAMQHNVTGRDKQMNGGTGLPTFLQNIKGKIDQHKSYLISNNICLYFDEKYVKENPTTHMFGFNECNSLNEIPDMNIFANPCYSINGILYNLMLIKSGGMI
jgi:hypothetical protein